MSQMSPATRRRLDRLLKERRETRATFTSIAAKCGISEGAVRYRREQLGNSVAPANRPGRPRIVREADDDVDVIWRDWEDSLPEQPMDSGVTFRWVLLWPDGKQRLRAGDQWELNEATLDRQTGRQRLGEDVGRRLIKHLGVLGYPHPPVAKKQKRRD